LFEALQRYGEHLQALVNLALETGMRLGELLNARWEDIAGASIHIRQTKTNKPRTVPLSLKAQGILKSLRQDASEEERGFDPKRMGHHRRQMMVCFK